MNKQISATEIDPTAQEPELRKHRKLPNIHVLSNKEMNEVAGGRSGGSYAINTVILGPNKQAPISSIEAR